MDEQKIVKDIVGRLRDASAITLETAKRLMDKVEAYARDKGLNCVLAVYDPHGNPVAVHVMEDAYLASYAVATQKAYTAVALKMSTKDLNALAQPGGQFYGIESLKGGQLVAFGGGVPLHRGGRIVGGLGVSGGTADQDHEIAAYGQRIFEEEI